MATKRPHYFDHQFLVEADFTDEQKYHLEMRRRMNRVLHTFGIAEGLEVVKQTNKIVTVRPGVAIDRLGKEMILEAAQDVDLSAITTAVPAFITIAYDEQQTDPSTATGASGNTRFTEQPILQALTTPPPTDGSVIRLARIDLTAGGNVPGNPNDAFDGGVRQTAGPRGERGLASIDGVSNPGGNVDLVPANAITIVSDDANNRITVGESHSARVDNPHTTTAAQVGALPIGGGTVNGALQVNGNIGVTGTVDGRDVSADGATLTAHVGITNGNPHGTTAAQIGAMPNTGGPITGDVQVSGRLSVGGTGNGTGAFLTGFNPSASSINAAVVGAYGTTSIGLGPRSALVGYSTLPEAYGVYAFASGTHSLFVQGTAQFTGAKTGYVVDTFVNASGRRLHTGDVVKLKGTPVARFHGDNNKIPVVEVTLADKVDDNMVIGITDREAIPGQDIPDTRVGPDDPTFIEDGGELLVVTLGAYAHCKVDATDAPIEVGDLLTSSANPGHAKKATNPKIGSIIGKALEPLNEGTGYIAVFVNIQ